jgi:hypothetical protein
MRFSVIATVLLTVCALTIHSSDLYSQGHATQTGCDTLSVNPPLVRIQFQIRNEGISTICRFTLGSAADSCRVLSCDVPDGWSCFPEAGVGISLWRDDDCSPGVPPGETLGPFEMTLDPFACCYEAAYFQSGIIEAINRETVCFECDKPVQVQAYSWGRLKVLYR